MLNFYCPFFIPCFGSHFDNGRHLENFEAQNCSSNGDLSLCQILCLYHYPFRSYLTMLNFCRIVAAILKMSTGRNFSMSGINSGQHYLHTYLILMISDNAEFLPPICMPCLAAILKMTHILYEISSFP